LININLTVLQNTVISNTIIDHSITCYWDGFQTFLDSILEVLEY
jgi:hypothetical protein